MPLTAEDPTADDWRAKLRDLVGRVYTVGVQDRFEEFVASLAERYGWTVSIPRSKVNPNRRPASELSAGTRERILAANWLDAELYEAASR